MICLIIWLMEDLLHIVYARGGSIPRYLNGGEPPKGQIVKRSDYADEAAYQLALRKAKLRADANKEDIYTLKPDGTYVKMKVSDKKSRCLYWRYKRLEW
jgi:hypothetical protein